MVDVSPERRHPEALGEPLRQQVLGPLRTFMDQVSNLLDERAGPDFHTLHLDPPYLVPTATAHLLDYPVAYFSTSKVGATCLSGVPLTLVQVCVKLPDGGESRVLYSFTYPAIATTGSVGEVDAIVDAWEKVLLDASGGAWNGCELYVVRSAVVRDQIVM